MGSIIYWQKISFYFGLFGIEYIPQEILNKIKGKSITHNIFRIQDNESIICGFYDIAFVEYVLSGKLCYIILIYFLQMTIKRMKK